MDATLAELDYDYAASLAARAIRAMAEQQIPATPDNFSIWFHYFLGVPSELRHAIDVLVDNHRPFDATTSHDLFVAYLESHEDSGTVHPFERPEAPLSPEPSEAGSDSRKLVAQLMSELAKTTTRARRLEAGFAEKKRELDAIRDSLSRSEQRANTDTLTGLPNRRALEKFFRNAQTSAMEHGTPLSLMLLDIDHFKKFNDNYGHSVGDQVLRLIAKVLRDKVREVDLPARYGGEELIAVLPDAQLTTCTVVAERIRRAIAESRISRRSTGEILPTITVSIGVAQFRPGESMADLIERCDRALYLAKDSGRNRVVAESELDHHELAAG